MNIRAWLKLAIAMLVESDSPKRDAEILLAFVTKKARTWLVAYDETELTQAQLARLDTLIKQRKQGEPIAYLIGEREFWSLPLTVSPATLIPRPDSEILVEHALACMPKTAACVLDLGCGTGAIALALASERADWQVTGIDKSDAAVALAQGNAVKLGIVNTVFINSHWFSALSGKKFDLIVSNPPYIDPHDPHLLEGDVRFEPRSALVAEEQGMADIRYIAQNAQCYLQPGGWLLLEHGWQQGHQVRDILRHSQFSLIETHRDYGGNERVTMGKK